MTVPTAALLAALPLTGRIACAQPADRGVEASEATEAAEQINADVVELFFESDTVEDEAVDEAVDVNDLPPEMIDLLLEQVRQHPELRESMLQQFPQLRSRLESEAEEPEQEPEPEVPADPEALIALEKKREQAEALIAQLADADDEQVRQIEVGLAELGEASLVPLKLAALSDDFELRTRAGQMARRLRWRLACSDQLISARPDLPAVLAAEDQQPRRTIVDGLLEDPESGLVGFFVECLADRDPYIRERGIDGLVKIGEAYSTNKAIKALEQAALNSDDESVVLLAVAGLGEVGQVNMAVLTELFESTDSAEVQRTVLLTAGYSRQASAIDLIERALRDPRWRVRAAGLEALEDISSYADKDRAGTLVRSLLADPEPFIRATAMRLISELELPGADTQLWEMLNAGQVQPRVALASLARLENAQAYTEITRRYDEATQADNHDEAELWLGMLSNYRERAAVDTLITTILNDKALRPQWRTAIQLASGRNNSNRFVPLVAPLLLDDDPALRAAVWNAFGRYGMNEYALPAELDRALASGDTEQRLWRTRLIYSSSLTGDPTEQLASVLSDNSRDVVRLALAMIAQLKIKDPLGEQDLPYRSSSRSYNYDEFGNPIYEAEPAPTLGDELAKALTGLLEHGDALVRVRSATLLYYTGKDRGEQTTAVLRAAIQSDLPEQQAIALKAAGAEPGPLVEGVDLVALTRDQEYQPLLHNAASVMLAIGEDKLVAEVLRIAEKIELRYEREFFLSIAASGTEPAINLINTKLAGEQGYTVRDFVSRLIPLNADAAVAIGAQALKLESLESYDRQDILRNLMQTRSEKLVPLLEAEVKRLATSRDHWERQNASQYEQMLIQLDPERAKKMIGEALKTGSAAEQQRAVQTLFEMEPADALAELVLSAALEREDGVDPAWGGLVSWVKQTAVFEKFERAISELPGPMQMAMLDDLATQADPSRLDTLLAITPADAEARDRVTMIVAELMTKSPQARSDSFQTLPAQARTYLLAAAGQWDGGEALIRPWLDSDDAPTADAALRGLAIARLLAEDQALAEADASRLVRGVKSADTFTAYLAAETLYQLDRPRLLAIDTKEVRSGLALLRIGCARYERDGGPVDLAVDAALRDQSMMQSTATRFALIAAINADQSRLYRIAAQAALTYHGDLAVRAATTFGTFQEFVQAVLAERLQPDDPGVDELLRATVERLAPRGDYNIGLLIQQGFIKRIPTAELGNYLDGYARFHSNNWGYGEGNLLSPLLDQEDPGLQAALKKAIGDNRPGSLFAAMAAWHLYRDEPAMAFVIDQALAVGEDARRQMGAQQRQYAALSFVQTYGRPADAPKLLEAHAKIANDEDWQAQNLRAQLLSAAVRLDPDATRDYLKQHLTLNQGGDDAFGGNRGNDNLPVDSLNAMVVDSPKFEELGLPGSGLAITEALVSVKSGGEVAARLTQPPWGPNANADVDADFAELAKSERELALAWVRTGEADPEKLQAYRNDSYQLPDWMWAELAVALPHESEVLQMRYRGELNTAVLLNDPDTVGTVDFYCAIGQIMTFAPLHAGQQEAAEALGPMISDTDPSVASRAIRAAAVWRATEHREALLGAVGRADQAGLEAAWASAILFGRDALDAVTERMRSAADFDERVELACLFVLLGADEAARPVLDQAQRLLAVQQLRGRAVTHSQANGPGNYPQNFDDFGHHQGFVAQAEPSVDGLVPGSNARWSSLLHAVSPEPADSTLARRLDLAPPQRGYIPIDNDQEPESTEGALSLRVTQMSGLVFDSAGTHGLPLRELVGLDAPAFAHLDQFESSLFARSLTAHAPAATDTLTLAEAWRKWITDHAADDPDTLWKAGLASATDGLNDAHWWRRCLALERLRRLTGRDIQTPALFDMEQWKALSEQWRTWSGTEDGASLRAALSAAGLEAGLIDAAPTNADEELAMLVRLAGWGGDALSLAALHRLELWPDGDALLRAAAPWQASPRPALRAWYLGRATDTPRIHVGPDEIGS